MVNRDDVLDVIRSREERGASIPDIIIESGLSERSVFNTLLELTLNGSIFAKIRDTFPFYCLAEYKGCIGS